jgi:pimeloyl-ACP methyl ester carboxylesterase
VAYATNRGCRIFYDVEGDDGAPTLLLIRGLARSARYWGEVARIFARDHRVVVFDNRGVGHSDATLPPYSTSLMADDAAAVLDALNIERAHVFGMSLGGMIAQMVALRHANRVDRLVLGCTTPGGRRAESSSMKVLARMVRSGMLPPAAGVRRVAPLLLSRETIEQRSEVLDEWIEIASSERKSRRGLFGQLLAGARHDADVGGIRARTLVLTGDADRLIPPENSRLLAELIPNSELVMLEGVGHDFTSDRPEQSADVVGAFLRD